MPTSANPQRNSRDFKGSLYAFLSQVRLTPQCWYWTGYKDPSGYGRVPVDYKPGLAHRYSWNIFVGSIPEGMLLCHKCDTPSCVNPDHMFVGTHQDNMTDMISKGRADHSNNRKGEDHHKAILTEANVTAIRTRYAVGDIPQWLLAQQYGVCRSTIGKLLSGKNWKSVKGGKLCLI